MLKTEPLAGAAKTTHHFIHDEQNTMPVTQFTQGLQVTLRVKKTTRRTGLSFEQNGGYVLGAFVMNQPFHLLN